jgi:hypothetical protein
MGPSFGTKVRNQFELEIGVYRHLPLHINDNHACSTEYSAIFISYTFCTICSSVRAKIFYYLIIGAFCFCASNKLCNSEWHVLMSLTLYHPHHVILRILRKKYIVSICSAPNAKPNKRNKEKYLIIFSCSNVDYWSYLFLRKMRNMLTATTVNDIAITMTHSQSFTYNDSLLGSFRDNFCTLRKILFDNGFHALVRDLA